MKVEGDYTCDICEESFETNVDIAGHMRAHQVSISAETIIGELQRLADEKGHNPTQPEIENETEFTEGAVSSTFGTWSEGLEAAGLEPRTNGYTDTEVIKELQRVAAQIGHSPSRNEWQEHGEISAKTVRAHFGSWNEGLRAANLETTPQQTATEEDVRAESSATAGSLRTRSKRSARTVGWSSMNSASTTGRSGGRTTIYRTACLGVRGDHQSVADTY